MATSDGNIVMASPDSIVEYKSTSSLLKPYFVAPIRLTILLIPALLYYVKVNSLIITWSKYYAQTSIFLFTPGIVVIHTIPFSEHNNIQLVLNMWTIWFLLLFLWDSNDMATKSAYNKINMIWFKGIFILRYIFESKFYDVSNIWCGIVST